LATGEVRCASRVAGSGSSNSIGARLRRMCHSSSRSIRSAIVSSSLLLAPSCRSANGAGARPAPPRRSIEKWRPS
jgi:hypothetical protein